MSNPIALWALGHFCYFLFAWRDSRLTHVLRSQPQKSFWHSDQCIGEDFSKLRVLTYSQCSITTTIKFNAIKNISSALDRLRRSRKGSAVGVDLNKSFQKRHSWTKMSRTNFGTLSGSKTDLQTMYRDDFYTKTIQNNLTKTMEPLKWSRKPQIKFKLTNKM